MAAVDSYTKLLLHCDGADASPTFTDSSLSPKTITRVGTAQLDTAQKKFGTASGLFDGNSDYLTTPDHADWDFDSGDFTIDFWARMPDITSASFMIMVSQGQDTNNRWMLYWDKTNGMAFFHNLASSTLLTFSQGGVAGWVVNTFYHIALVRYGNEWDIYRNGISIANATDADDMSNFNAKLVIGENEWSGAPEAGVYYEGWMDEIRISKGIARWKSNFTPPIQEYGVPDAGNPMMFAGGAVIA